MSDALNDSEFKAQFAGHETFPLRLLWLKKAFDAVENGAERGTFQEQGAIAKFGVGRNMVLAIRHWAMAAGFIQETADGFAATAMGKLFLSDRDGVDPYLEDPGTAWWVHTMLAGTPEQTTTFFYGFNGLTQATFDRPLLVRGLSELAAGRKSWRASTDTLKRDVEVFIRSYVGRSAGGEDAAEPLLAELCLIREASVPGQFEFVRGPKPTLPDGLFAVALRRFWRRWHNESPTLSLEQASYGAGSPGRLFKLDDDGLHHRLSRIDAATGGALSWTDTAGLRQVIFHRELDEASLLRGAFKPRLRGAA